MILACDLLVWICKPLKTFFFEKDITSKGNFVFLNKLFLNVSLIISDKSNFSFYIPPGFAHGFMCLTKKCTVNYKCSNYRDPKSEKTLKWNDNTVKIKWPKHKPILSDKDKKGADLISFK